MLGQIGHIQKKGIAIEAVVGRTKRISMATAVNRHKVLFLFSAIVLLAACKPEASKPSGPDLTSQMVTQQQTIPNSYCHLPAMPPAPNASQQSFSIYAWKLFTAMNWPASKSQRGQPDCTKPIGSSASTVWQSYKTSQQIFLPNAVDPGPWNQGNTGPLRLQYTSKAPAVLHLPPSIRQAVGGWLIDQQSNPTYYEIAVNQTSYNYIRNNHYYNANVLNSASNIELPAGALEIKAAWRIMQNADTHRYLTKTVQVMIFDANGKPTGKYRMAQVGLVGLHIVYKPKGYPQWIWATFEQVDNVGAHGSGVSASYYNPKCSGQYCTPNTSPIKSGQPFGTPNQLTRLTSLLPATQSINTKWRQQLIGTPFQFYQLISPQWPSDPNDPGNPQGTPTPGTVANVTMESYIQPTSSCMDCHSTARVPNGNIKTNYSFIFLFAQQPSK
jgi:hypothetical protein